MKIIYYMEKNTYDVSNNKNFRYHHHIIKVFNVKIIILTILLSSHKVINIFSIPFFIYCEVVIRFYDSSCSVIYNIKK